MTGVDENERKDLAAMTPEQLRSEIGILDNATKELGASLHAATAQFVGLQADTAAIIRALGSVTGMPRTITVAFYEARIDQLKLAVSTLRNRIDELEATPLPSSQAALERQLAEQRRRADDQNGMRVLAAEEADNLRRHCAALETRRAEAEARLGECQRALAAANDADRMVMRAGLAPKDAELHNALRRARDLLGRLAANASQPSITPDVVMGIKGQALEAQGQIENALSVLRGIG